MAVDQSIAWIQVSALILPRLLQILFINNKKKSQTTRNRRRDQKYNKNNNNLDNKSLKKNNYMPEINEQIVRKNTTNYEKT